MPRIATFCLFALVVSCSGRRPAPDGASPRAETPATLPPSSAPPAATAPAPAPVAVVPSPTPVVPSLPAGSPIRMIAIGESWTEGQGDDTDPPGYVGIVARRLAETRPGSTYTSLGCGGWSAPQLLREGCDGRPVPVAAVESARPTHVTILIGQNDVADWRWSDADAPGDFSVSQYEEALRGVYTRIAATGARIIQLEVPDLSRFPVARTWTERKRRILRERVAEANAAIHRVARARNGVVVRIHSIEALYAPAHYVPDGFHLTRRGYTVIADALWAVLAREIAR